MGLEPWTEELEHLRQDFGWPLHAATDFHVQTAGPKGELRQASNA
jgi:hypothetical protein